jgi:hypothetical protein
MAAKKRPNAVKALEFIEAAEAACDELGGEAGAYALAICRRLYVVFAHAGEPGPHTRRAIKRAADALLKASTWKKGEGDKHAVAILEQELPHYIARPKAERFTAAFHIAVALGPFIGTDAANAPSKLVPLFDSFDVNPRGKRGKRSATSIWAELAMMFGIDATDAYGGKRKASPLKAIRLRMQRIRV